MATSKLYKIVLMGVGGVGKSCLTLQFFSGTFVDDYDPTLMDCYRKQMTIDGEECILDIFDTAGQDDFIAVRDQYMRSGDGFMFVYSIILEESFNEAITFHGHVLRLKELDSVPFLIVGNKCDLENQRRVSQERAQQLAQDFNCPWIEVSAKTRHNVPQAFELMVREIRKWRAIYGEHAGSQRQSNGDHSSNKKKKRCIIL
jgi:GTPase KRas protein